MVNFFFFFLLSEIPCGVRTIQKELATSGRKVTISTQLCAFKADTQRQLLLTRTILLLSISISASVFHMRENK